ncbi:MAG: hypothetical protein J07HQW1_00529 [Haloquadratum walsbyi J07HQW1]|jgi:hypothetical protein|uniref:Uncharacterized protein n=1 Tax=Haloquadratum walsbyi J07HQW1 TaxID=1238424 RepID=U1PEJ4_9EURY|nr:MAG: hypothetical protein J07HQW1_00529 [Haloquadratum walsbyi J07HQW1]
MTDKVNQSPGVDAPSQDFGDHWDSILTDIETTATRYDNDGWKSLALHPGHVTPLAGKPDNLWGFDVLLPDDEFAILENTVADVTITDYELFSTEASGGVFLMSVTRAESETVAIIFPLYYRLGDDSISALKTHTAETGSVRTYLRRLENDRRIEFQYDKPGLFFPSQL